MTIYEELGEDNLKELVDTFYNNVLAEIDSVYHSRISQQIHELEVIHETQKNETNLAFLEKEKTIKESTISKQKAYLMIGGLLLLALSIFSFGLISKNREKEKNNQGITQNKKAKSQN